MSLNTLLIDDERKSLDVLKHKIESFCQALNIIAETQCPKEGLELIERLNPDLVFLDIAMPKMSGFDLLSKIEKPDFELIFVTAFDKYAIEAINNCAIGYVLKPIDNNDLTAAVSRAINNVNQKEAIQKSLTLIENLSVKKTAETKIAIPLQNGLEFIALGDIIHCQGEKGYTKLFVKGRKPMLSSYNLGYFSKQLLQLGFFLVHKSHLINLEYVRRFLNEGYVVLKDDSRIPVSKNRKSEFLRMMG